MSIDALKKIAPYWVNANVFETISAWSRTGLCLRQVKFTQANNKISKPSYLSGKYRVAVRKNSCEHYKSIGPYLAGAIESASTNLSAPHEVTGERLVSSKVNRSRI